MYRIVWGDEKKVLDITEVFLRNCCGEGKPTWLLEDPDFVKSVLLGASFVYEEGAFVTWLAHFLGNLSKESEQLARKVSILRIKKYRPEVYEAWLRKASEK